MITPDLIGSSGHAALAAVMALGGLDWISSFFSGKKTSFADDRGDEPVEEEGGDDLPEIPMEEREEDGIYQHSNFHGERLVGRAVDFEIDDDGEVVRFAEISHSDYLLVPDEFEFRNYRLQIKKIDDAVKKDKLAEHKGRILYGVTAEVVGTEGAREH